ncbi:hypothetical protein DRQ26_06430, partial [bacterium]
TLCISILTDTTAAGIAEFQSAFPGWDYAHKETCFVWETDPGGVEIHMVLELDTISMGIHKKPITLPQKATLGQNSPNPFNSSTDIEFSLPEGANVSLVVTDVLGKHIRTLVNEHRAKGTYKVRWDGLDDEKNEVPSGVYFYKLTVDDNFVDKKKMTLLK